MAKISGGYANELKIMIYLHNKKVSELTSVYKDMIEKLYGEVKDDDIVYCNVDFEQHKNDIIITINNINKYVSIKMGRKNSFHSEPLDNFLEFMRTCGIPEKYVTIYRDFHIGYVVDEKGLSKFVSTEEYKKYHQSDIDGLNEILKQDYFYYPFINRCIIQGTKNHYYEIDGVLHGNDIFFHFYTVNEIYDLLDYYKNHYSTGVHVSRLFVGPHARCLNGNARYKGMKKMINVKWYNIFDDARHIEIDNTLNKSV